MYKDTRRETYVEGFVDLISPLGALNLAGDGANAASLGQAGSRLSHGRVSQITHQSSGEVGSESGVKVDEKNTAGALSPGREVDVNGIEISLPSKGKSVEAPTEPGIPLNRASNMPKSIRRGRRGTVIL